MRAVLHVPVPCLRRCQDIMLPQYQVPLYIIVAVFIRGLWGTRNDSISFGTLLVGPLAGVHCHFQAPFSPLSSMQTLHLIDCSDAEFNAPSNESGIRRVGGLNRSISTIV